MEKYIYEDVMGFWQVLFLCRCIPIDLENILSGINKNETIDLEVRSSNVQIM